jgi:hypothetical protein
MLALKSLSAKKNAIYTFIIILMLLGIVFTLYQNQKLSGHSIFGGSPPDESMASEVTVPGGETTLNSVLNDLLKTETKPLRSIKSIKGVDLAIFSSEKFKLLEENTLIPYENAGLGKRNPFSPY